MKLSFDGLTTEYVKNYYNRTLRTHDTVHVIVENVVKCFSETHCRQKCQNRILTTS